jgi:hypothetical protein
MKTLLLRITVALALVFAGISVPASAQKLVNMVPNSRSAETNQDAEPTITVDPNNPLHLAGSAFTYDNLTGSPMATATAPIYVSSNGGDTWTMALIVPSKVGASFPTGDITLSFSSTPSGAIAHSTSWLYGGILSSTASPRPMTTLRAQDPFSAALMTALDAHPGNVDQPHTLAKTGAGQDKLYVGFNNGFGCVIAGGRTSTLDVSQNAQVAAPALTLDLIESRTTPCQDGFAQVPAAHKDGTVYAAFIHDWSGTPRIVVVRDDNWGSSISPFSALTDPSDTKPGRFVTTGLTLASGSMGQNRLGASNVSIAVDPNNSDRVYVAWGDSNGFNSETVHVRRSINRGQDWSGDLLTVNNAMNPEVAINDLGIVGVLYQAVNNNRWETRLVLSDNLDSSTFATPGTLLANQSASTPLDTFSPYIGDYASLVASGRNFVGTFSASNFPDKANFMLGVSYQREVDWTTHKLFANVAHTIEVPPSIDPFFFEIPTTLCEKSLIFCNICRIRPEVCYPIYDPWWWLKCPECGIIIYVDPGEEFQTVPIAVFNSLGQEVGRVERLREPVVENGVKYNFAVKLKVQEGVGYVLRADVGKDRKLKGAFTPETFVKLEGREQVK